MNNTQKHEILPMSKKDRRYRMPYVHIKTVKRKLVGLRKHQCRWQERQERCTQ